MHLNKKVKTYSRGWCLWKICKNNPHKKFLYEFNKAICSCNGYSCSLYKYIEMDMCYVKREDIH